VRSDHLSGGFGGTAVLLAFGAVRPGPLWSAGVRLVRLGWAASALHTPHGVSGRLLRFWDRTRVRPSGRPDLEDRRGRCPSPRS